MNEDNLERPVDDYLRQWGLETYIGKFQEQAIDIETLQMLSENDIKDLIPIIGHRAKLTTQIKMLRSLSEAGNQVSISKDQQPVLTDSVLNFIFEPNTSGALTLENLEPIELEANSIEGTSPNTSCELYNILSACNEGKSLLLRFQEIGLLNNASRRKLCNIIIDNELRNEPDKKIKSSRLYQLAYDVPRIFKKENSSVYFIPFMSFNPGQKTSAKGKLLDCYRQRRREFIKSGVIAEPGKQSPSTSRTSSYHTNWSFSVQEAIDQLHELTEDIDEKLLWLKNCCDPWVTVELYWEITAKKRLSDLTSSEVTVEDYLRDFKPLNQPGGVFLLLKDFKKLYPETDDKLFQNWPIVRPKIIEEAKKRSYNGDSGLKDIITDINDEDEVLDLIGFMALPFLMTTSIVKKATTNSKKRWRPSKHEALQGFISHVKTAAEIEETVTRRKAKVQDLGLTLQPFIIVVGPSLKQISARYIIVNKLRYEMPSIVKTVDACFKLLFVLSAEYSAESTHVWQFIQKYLFTLSTKYDKIFTTVRTLATDLSLEE